MDIRAYNKEAWDRQVAEGNPWTVPVTPEVISAAREGRWSVILTAEKPVPPRWFPPLAGLDVLGRLRTGLQPGSSTPAHIRAAYGGVARNVAENLARLGLPVRLVTAVGEDAAGDGLLQAAIEAGVDTGAVLSTPAEPTGAYLAIVNSTGGLQYALDDMRAITALTPEYIRSLAPLFYESALVFVDANLMPHTLETIFSLAADAQLPVCADPTSTLLAERLRPFLDQLYIVVPNKVEAAILCGREQPEDDREILEAAKCLVTHGAEIAIITLAELGLCYATSVTSGFIPAIHTPILDPTGAGDALTGAVIFALLNDIPLDDAVRLGVSAASLTLRHMGAVCPDLSLEKLYDQLII